MRYVIFILLAACLLTICLAARGEKDLPPSIRKTVLSVEAFCPQKGDYQLQIPGWGFIEPRETVDIHAEIPGKVSFVPASVYAGAKVKQGEMLCRIDERDYRIALGEAKAEHEQARQALTIEQGRQAIAKSEWKMLENSKWQGRRNKTLALRQPQMKERKAALQMTAAKLARAALNLERSRITAPCDGVILSEQLARGRFLDIGSVALRMACTDRFNVMASFSPVYSIDPATQSVELNAGSRKYEGTVKAVLPRLDPETRHKQVLVEFKSESVTLGDYVSLILPGPVFKNATIIPREALRSGNAVWLINRGGKLEIREVKVLGKDKYNAVIGQGLSEHDCVVLSHIANPLQGMELRPRQQLTPNVKGSAGNEGQNG